MQRRTVFCVSLITISSVTCHLFNLHVSINTTRHTEINTAESLEPEPSAFEVDKAVYKLT